MATCSSVTSKKKGFSVRELEVYIENEWSDDDEIEPHKKLSNAMAIDIVVLPPDDVDVMTDTEDVPDDQMFCDDAEPIKTDGGLASVPEICGYVEMHVENPDADNDDDDDDNLALSFVSRQQQQTHAVDIDPPKWRKRVLQTFEQSIDMSDIAIKNLAEKYGKYSSAFDTVCVLYMCTTLHSRLVLSNGIVAAIRG